MLVSVAKQVETVASKETNSKRNVVSFLVKCGEAQVKTRIVEFKNEDGKDPAYAGRVAVLSAFVGLPVQLFKREGTYVDSEGETRRFTNYEIMCGDDPIPVEVVFNGNGEGKDPMYGINRRILSAFAELRPERQTRVNSGAVSESIPTDESSDTGLVPPPVEESSAEVAKPEQKKGKPTLQAESDNTDIPF